MGETSWDQHPIHRMEWEREMKIYANELIRNSGLNFSDLEQIILTALSIGIGVNEIAAHVKGQSEEDIERILWDRYGEYQKKLKSENQ